MTIRGKVLFAVMTHPGAMQKEIAEILGVRFQHVWRSLDELVTEGILEKHKKERRTHFTVVEDKYKTTQDYIILEKHFKGHISHGK